MGLIKFIEESIEEISIVLGGSQEEIVFRCIPCNKKFHSPEYMEIHLKAHDVLLKD